MKSELGNCSRKLPGASVTDTGRRQTLQQFNRHTKIARVLVVRFSYAAADLPTKASTNLGTIQTPPNKPMRVKSEEGNEREKLALKELVSDSDPVSVTTAVSD